MYAVALKLLQTLLHGPPRRAAVVEAVSYLGDVEIAQAEALGAEGGVVEGPTRVTAGPPGGVGDGADKRPDRGGLKGEDHGAVEDAGIRAQHCKGGREVGRRECLASLLLASSSLHCS